MVNKYKPMYGRSKSEVYDCLLKVNEDKILKLIEYLKIYYGKAETSQYKGSKLPEIEGESIQLSNTRICERIIKFDKKAKSRRIEFIFNYTFYQYKYSELIVLLEKFVKNDNAYMTSIILSDILNYECLNKIEQKVKNIFVNSLEIIKVLPPLEPIVFENQYLLISRNFSIDIESNIAKKTKIYLDINARNNGESDYKLTKEDQMIMRKMSFERIPKRPMYLKKNYK